MMLASGAQRAATISFRQLKLFESIGLLHSVRRASEECSLSQPAVTQALAKLEEQVGMALVDRRASGSYLNEAGTLFHARVRRFFAQVEQAIIDLGVAGDTGAAQPLVKRITRAQVRTLIACIDNGSFERAAAAIGISLASLQRGARDLEGNLRASLFYRTAAGTLVGPAGVEFGRKMKLALQEIEWGLEELDATRGRAGRQIVIGAMPFGGSMLLASVLDEFLAMHPQADVRITNDSASEMAKSLRSGDVDFVVGLLPATSVGLVGEPVADTPYSIVVRRGHPLARKGKATIDDLVAFDWVVGTTGSSRRACFERLFAGRQGPRAQIATCALPVVRHLLARSDRLTLMTSYELLHEDDLRAVPFEAIRPVPSIGITMRADWLPTQLHTDFIALVRTHMTQPPALKIVRAAG